MKRLPKARNTEIVVQELGKELLIYDLVTNQAYQLSETSMIVYQACDGSQTFETLQKKHKFTEDFIYLALDELAKQKLLSAGYESKFAAVSRRDVIKKVGLACAAALPIIVGLTAPTAAAAASACVNPGGMAAGELMYNCGTFRYGICQAGCQGNPVGLRNCCSNMAKIDPATCPVGTDPDVTGCRCICA